MKSYREVFEKIMEDRNSPKGFQIIYEPKFLRHFTAKFKRLQ